MSDYVLKLSEAEVARYRAMAEAAVRTEQDLWTTAGVVAGAKVADVGCGPGAISVALAGAVAPGGTVHGVDRDPQALALARQWADQNALSNLSFSEGSADDTGLPAGSFDVVMLRHVLAHNGGQEQAIVNHLASLVLPGGCVYLVDVDVAGVRIHPPDASPGMIELGDRYRQLHAQLGNDLSVGLRLGELLERAGLGQVDHRGHYQIMRPPPGMRPPSWAARDQMLEAGILTEEDIARYEAEFARVDQGELRPTLFFPIFTAFARKSG